MKISRSPRYSERSDYDEGDEAEASSPSSPPVREDGFQYDVFLSFRGPDTRNHFTGHLYDKLNDKGIVTFIDSEKLEKGQKVEDLLEYIRKSKIFVPIFSEGYADSKWCLKEIAAMVECKRLILPVFFDVEPRDVRDQTTGPFADAFRRHRESNNIDKEEVSKWSGALTKAGEVSGYNLADTKGCNGDQAKLVRLIVKRILREVNKTTPLDVGKHPVGLDSRIEDVMKLLDVEAQDGARMVGIHAMGGMGKTTLAKAVYNQISTRFEACSFISNVREVAKQPTGLVSLQKQLLHDVFNDKEIEVNSTDQGISKIKKRIGSKKVLLVLDDVDHKSQLEALAGGVNWFGSGSKIIITTRDKKILKEQSILNLYKLKGLDDTQSLQLFSWHAFGKEEPNSEFAKLSKEVAVTANGLPLALQIFGSDCFNLDNEEQWREKLEKLTNVQNKDIHEKLKISYDVLDEQEKKVFLDIACFFIGNGRKFATFMWKDCKFFPKTTINVLVDKSLVNINDDTKEFEMHDQIRDMGRKIVQDESLPNPEMCCNRLWKDADETLDLLKDKRETKNVEAIQLFCRNFMSVSEEPFAAMFQLRMLRLGYKVRLEGRHQYFPSKLRWLEWHPRDLDSLRDGLYLENIVVLDLSNSSVSQLWNPQKSARTKAFGKLKVLNLFRCQNLTSCPDFKIMPQLLELNLEGCRKMSALHPSIGDLKWLTHLSLKYCHSLEELPIEVWQLTSLEEFYLCGCSQITALPMQKKLVLDKLKVLDLTGCRKLRICPKFTSMPLLETLSFADCGEMSELHPSIGDLKWLTHLKLSYCLLKELPPEIWQLTSLQEFDLSGCCEITVLPPQKRLLLDKLKVLDLTGCWKLRICPEFIGMPHLERLSFNGCGEMSELHPSIGCLKSLIDLDLRACHSLNELPKQIWQLTALEMIGYNYYSKITQRSSHLGDLELFKESFLGNKLKVLSLYDCKNITKCPDFTSMPHIKILDFSGCEKMSELHPSIGHLKGLTTLNLSGCKSLKELPREIWQLTLLEEFHLSNCPQFTAFPDFMSILKCLTVLDLSGCISLKELPEEIGQLTSLERLTLDSCSRISTLPESMGHLKQLNSLSLSKCSSLKEVPKGIVSLDMLEYLTVAGCVQLKFLPQLPPSLSYIDATGCHQLEIIATVSNLDQLQIMHLDGCERLVEIPGIEKLCLKTLGLEGCRNLCNSFWEILQEAYFPHLDHFSISESRIEWEASFRQSLSFLLPEKFEGISLYLLVEQSSMDRISSKVKSKLTDNSLMDRIVRMEITEEDAQYSFSTLVNKRVEHGLLSYVATFGINSELMKRARDICAAQRKTLMMMMHVSIDGCILLHGDLFTDCYLNNHPDGEQFDSYFDKVGENIVKVEILRD